jgi:hypothetical protein
VGFLSNGTRVVLGVKTRERAALSQSEAHGERHFPVLVWNSTERELPMEETPPESRLNPVKCAQIAVSNRYLRTLVRNQRNQAVAQTRDMVASRRMPSQTLDKGNMNH